MNSIFKLKDAIDAANETHQPRECTLSSCLIAAEIALEDAGNQTRKYGWRWIADEHRKISTELHALTLSAK